MALQDLPLKLAGGTAAGGTIVVMAPPEANDTAGAGRTVRSVGACEFDIRNDRGVNPLLVETLAEAEDAIYDAELVIPSLCMEGLVDIDDIMFCAALDPDPPERYGLVKFC